MRILHIGKFFPPFAGGIEAFTADLCRSQAQSGHDVAALVHSAPGERRLRPARDRGVLVVRAPVHLHLGFAPVAVGYRSVLRRMIRSFRPDILHMHVPNPSTLWALTLSECKSIPWVAHWHSDIVASPHNLQLRLGYPLYRPLERAFLRRCDRIIATSPPYLESSGPLQRFRHKCTVVPLGLDLVRMEPVCDRTVWPPTDRFRLICVGRFSYYKSLDKLIHSIAAMERVSLALVGNGPAHADLARQIKELRAEDRIHIHSGLSDEQRNALLAQADALVLPSQERTEAFGVVLLEAMRWQKPVIVADIPGSGAPWLVRSSDAGLVVPIGQWERLVEAIESLRNQPAMRGRLGEQGTAALAERFSIKAVARQIDSVYSGVLSA